MTTLARVLSGSRLYGTDNPTSDWDWKQVHLPSINDCLLLKAARNVHTKDESGPVKVESESFALQEFLALAARGEDVAMTMLHADDKAVSHSSDVFNLLRRERSRFYTKSMSGMAGYCRGMASKYALRADRMQTVEEVIMVLESMEEAGIARLGQAWDLLLDLPHTRKFENVLDRGADRRIYEVAGKGLPATVTPTYALDILLKVRDSYGARVKAAKDMAGQDLKAISHSFRVGYQLKHIYQQGDFYFPLPETPFIKGVKDGTLRYVEDSLDTRLNDLITEVEELAAKSEYPQTVDTKWLDEIVIEAYDSR